MPEAIERTFELVSELFADGFLAVMAMAVVAPLLGTLLVLRRMPLLGLAVPQVAGCGQAFAFLLFARVLHEVDPADPEPPPAALQLLGSAAAVALGMVALVLPARDGRFVGVYAGILFLASVALQDVMFLESPYHESFDEALHHGRVLTVLEPGRNLVLVSCGVLLAVAVLLRRPLCLSAFDPDQAKLLGHDPGRWLLVTVVLIGALSALCVHEVGPEVVLALLLVPPAILRPVTPSLALYAPLASLAGVLGGAASFVLAVAGDWPASPALLISVLASSLVVAAVTRAVRFLASFARGPSRA